MVLPPALLGRRVGPPVSVGAADRWLDGVAPSAAMLWLIVSDVAQGQFRKARQTGLKTVCPARIGSRPFRLRRCWMTPWRPSWRRPGRPGNGLAGAWRVRSGLPGGARWTSPWCCGTAVCAARTPLPGGWNRVLGGRLGTRHPRGRVPFSGIAVDSPRWCPVRTGIAGDLPAWLLFASENRRVGARGLMRRWYLLRSGLLPAYQGG